MELLVENNRELEKFLNVIDKLDAHCRFHLLKDCFSMPYESFFLQNVFRSLLFGTLRQIIKKFIMQGHK